ncbi:hypothetical protein DNH49_02815 [Salmonella enterica]|nr:hypothetical protein [Salmonella enterica]EBK6962695.1 hypothetical protein [Salmonella enterica]
MIKAYIHFIFQAASLLAAIRNPGHTVIYARGDFFPCRCDASLMILCIIMIIISIFSALT